MYSYYDTREGSPCTGGKKKESIAEVAEQLHYFLGTSAVCQFTAFFPDPQTK